MNLSIENMQSIFIVLLVTLFVFILIRELICWYLKINERVQLLKEALVNQNKIINLLTQGNQYLSEQRADKVFNNVRR